MRQAVRNSQWMPSSDLVFGRVVGWALGAFIDVDPVVVTDLTQSRKNCRQMAVGTRHGVLGAGNNFKTC